MLIDNIKNLEELKEIIDKTIDINIITMGVGAGKNNALILLKNYLFNLIIEQKEKLKPKETQKINLKRIFNRQYTSTTKLNRIYENSVYINRNIGTVPKIFIENASNKKQRANQLYDLFGKYALILNYDYSHDIEVSKIAIPCYTDKFAEDLGNLIDKKVTISFVGNGYFGNGFKISITDNDMTYNYFYKTFYPYSKVQKHGADVEVIYAYFAKRYSRKNQFVKFYMGRLASPYEKDVFLLTEFLEKDDNYVPKNNIVYLDYLYSQDGRIDNTINGKIVDFGAVREYIPELNDKNLNKMVRLILSRLTRKVDNEIIKYTWKMSDKNCYTLKQYVEKHDFNTYQNAINIIEKHVSSIPKEIFDDLLNIKMWEKSHSINISRQLKTNDIIVTDIETLKRNLKILNLKIKTSLDGKNNLFGYIIINLHKNRQLVVLLDNNNNITKMRFEKIVDQKIEVVLELTREDISSYEHDNLISIFNN